MAHDYMTAHFAPQRDADHVPAPTRHAPRVDSVQGNGTAAMLIERGNNDAWITAEATVNAADYR